MNKIPMRIYNCTNHLRQKTARLVFLLTFKPFQISVLMVIKQGVSFGLTNVDPSNDFALSKQILMEKKNQ